MDLLAGFTLYRNSSYYYHYLQLEEGQNIALHALPTVKESATLTAAFQVYSTPFFQILFKHKEKCAIMVNQIFFTNDEWYFNQIGPLQMIGH